MKIPSRRGDVACLDLVQELRRLAIAELTPAAARDMRDAARREGVAADDLDGLRDLAGSLPSVTRRAQLLYQSQTLNWQSVGAAYRPERDALLEELDAWEDRGPGGLELDPGLAYPGYYDPVEFHRQPGSYHRDPLAGYIYHWGTKVFYMGRNDRDELKSARVAALPDPERPVAAVLDLGCSVGQNTTALAGRWPDARVWGVDIAAPLLRYAHARAARMGVAVQFAQQPAEALAFDDGSFDVVYMSILLHELPLDVGRAALGECRRVLRPGGMLVIHDLNLLGTNRPEPDPWLEFDRDFDCRFNQEPYAWDFTHSDLGGTLRGLFRQVDARPDGPPTTRWICRL